MRDEREALRVMLDAWEAAAEAVRAAQDTIAKARRRGLDIDRYQAVARGVVVGNRAWNDTSQTLSEFAEAWREANREAGGDA